MAQRGRKSAAYLETMAFVRARSDADRLQTATDTDRAYWRSLYDEAWRPGFRFDTGQRHWVEGPEARRRHYEQFDVPQGLIAEWDQARKRRR